MSTYLPAGHSAPRALHVTVKLYARLGRGLVFDDEIAAQPTGWGPDRMQFGSGEGVRDSQRFRGSEGLSGAGPSGCGDRIGVRRAKGSGRGAKGSGEQRGSGEPWRIKRMEVPVSSFIRSLILHLHISHSHLHLHSLYFSRTSLNHKLYFSLIQAQLPTPHPAIQLYPSYLSFPSLLH